MQAVRFVVSFEMKHPIPLAKCNLTCLCKNTKYETRFICCGGKCPDCLPAIDIYALMVYHAILRAESDDFF